MSYIIEKKDRRSKFKNVHENYKGHYQAKVKLFNDPDKKNFTAYTATSKDISKLIKLSLLEKTRIRVCGSRWSLSKAPYTNGILIFNVNEDDKPDMKFKGFLGKNYLESESETNEFLFAQCGNTIKELNAYCEKAKRSLPTSGASNGQTIAGAVSTGVNGSALQVGCVQDFLVGLHIIKGEKSADSVYLEPKNAPVINEKFAKKIKATIIRDDDLFYAALVGIGSFGFVHGVMIQTVPLFNLHNIIKKVDIKDAYKFTETLSIKNTPLLIGYQPEDLYHLKFYINQYDYKNNVRAEIIYKIPEGSKTFVPPGLLNYAKDMIIKAGAKIVNLLDDLIPPLINKLIPKPGGQEIGTLGEIFGDSSNVRGGQFSCGIGVAAENAKKVTQIMLKHFRKKGVKKIPAALSYRFAKQSKATLAFTQFKMTCIIGLDGVENKNALKYLEDISTILAKSDIPHTWHWGKQHHMNAAFVKKAYGRQLTKWKQQRQGFLSPEVAQTFSSEYLDGLGLTAQYV